MPQLLNKAIASEVEHFLAEDDLTRNTYYLSQLPSDEALCSLKIKSDMLLAGLPYFRAVFTGLGHIWPDDEMLAAEGKFFQAADQISLDFKAPFNIALTAERVALNLLQRAASVASHTKSFVDKAQKYNIKILDTRKTTPGLRSLEKYAVVLGGGYNHRMGPSDIWMVKDNHKVHFGGIKAAVKFFEQMKSFYSPIVVEIHSLDELQQAFSCGVKNIMLDNFTAADIVLAVAQKPAGVNYEVSGGVTLFNIEQYLIEGVDAISIGALTYAAPAVDLSMKISRG